MIEELLTAFSSILPSWSAQSLPPEALPLPYLCSILGAFVLGRYTGNLGNLTMALNFCALFLGAMLSTWLFKGLELPMDRAVHQPLLVALIGMLVSAFAMIWWLGKENVHT